MFAIPHGAQHRRGGMMPPPMPGGHGHHRNMGPPPPGRHHGGGHGRYGGRQPLTDPDDEFEGEEGDFPVFKGDKIHGRFEIKKILGSGTFGKVVLCKDLKNEKNVAIKLSKLSEDCRMEFENEIRVLQQIHSADREGRFHFAKLLHTFEVGPQLGMVFPCYGMSLYAFLSKTKSRPVPLEQIRAISRQLFRTLAFLHDCKLIHTDIKPENILIADSKYHNGDDMKLVEKPKVVLIDFGSTTHNHDTHDPEIGTAHYQSPEVLLRLDWSYAIDVWGVALCLLEMYTGKAAFKVDNEMEQLAAFQRVLGPLPSYMARMARLPTKELHRYKFQRGPKLADMIAKQDEDFYQFLKACLRMDPARRVTSHDALKHPFITGEKPVAKTSSQAESITASSVSGLSEPRLSHDGSSRTSGTFSQASSRNSQQENAPRHPQNHGFQPPRWEKQHSSQYERRHVAFEPKTSHGARGGAPAIRPALFKNNKPRDGGHKVHEPMTFAGVQRKPFGLGASGNAQVPKQHGMVKEPSTFRPPRANHGHGHNHAAPKFGRPQQLNKNVPKHNMGGHHRGVMEPRTFQPRRHAGRV